MKTKIDIHTLKIQDLQPSQFYISKEKLDGVLSWFNPQDLSNFEPIPIKVLQDKIVLMDGHTRIVAALLHNIDKVPLTWESDELSWDMYEACVEACIHRHIHSPYDLKDRIISKEEYKYKWDAWCDQMQEEVIKRRK